MPWSITAHGHSPDATCEGWLLHRITELLSGQEAGLRMLRIETDHFGAVELGDPTEPHTDNENRDQ